MLASAAQKLAQRGFAVFPCRVGQKIPATPHGYLDASTDPAVIAAWWRQQPNFNIGVATGAVSGIFVLDVDNHSADGETELTKLEAEHGALPLTVESITGSGGRHLFFKMPDCDLRNSESALAPGLDIRANGGLVVAPPSLHPNGRRYAWSVDSGKSFAAAPAWLIEKIYKPPAAATAATPAVAWRELVTGPIADGTRNATLSRVVGHLLRRRVDPLVALALTQALNIAKCSPPLDAAEVEHICDSICKIELERRKSFQ